MKDLLDRIKVQRKDAQVTRNNTKTNCKQGLDEAAVKQWVYFKTAHNYKRTMVVHEPWLDVECFAEWFVTNRQFDETFCFHLSLGFPLAINPQTCGWVHPEAAKFLDWIYASMCRRRVCATYPIGVMFHPTKTKLESSWRYDLKKHGDYYSKNSLEEAQIPFKKWFLEKVDQTRALIGDDTRIPDLMALREKVVKAIETNTVFHL